MIKIFNKVYPFHTLEAGDRFYFEGSKKKAVHEFRCFGGKAHIRIGQGHWCQPTPSQIGKNIVFLRQTGTDS